MPTEERNLDEEKLSFAYRLDEWTGTMMYMHFIRSPPQLEVCLCRAAASIDEAVAASRETPICFCTQHPT